MTGERTVTGRNSPPIANIPEQLIAEEKNRVWRRLLTGRKEQLFKMLTLVIGGLVGLLVVAFIAL